MTADEIRALRDRLYPWPPCAMRSRPDGDVCMCRDCHETARLRMQVYVGHHESSASCWCQPERSYVDPETGRTVWVHRGEQ